VVGDRTRLIGVFQNLLGNAVRFMGDVAAPRIEIGARREGDWVTCSVRDNGVGIEPGFRDRIFEVFTRLEPDEPGTGLGLALVKRIVTAHGGRVWVESGGRGTGATFWLTLPGVPAPGGGQGDRAAGEPVP
jgi:signal transduction histidine kinase